MRRLIAFFCICFIITASKAQPSNTIRYTDMVINGNDIWLLTKNGRLHHRNTENGSIDDSIKLPKPISCFTLTQNREIVAADSSGSIVIFDGKSGLQKEIAKVQAPVFNIVYNRKNEGFAINRNGIVDLQTKIQYPEDTAYNFNPFLKRPRKPSAIFVDKDNNLWLGFDSGEWGGDLFVFSTTEKKYLSVKAKRHDIELNPLVSIFSDGINIYASSGLDHLFSQSGAILKFKNFRCRRLFVSNSSTIDSVIAVNGKKEKTKFIKGGLYIGPALYNPADQLIYFYSADGIYKGDPKTYLSKITKWKRIFQPHLHWEFGRADAAGYPMSVLKMQFANNGKLYLLTRFDGLGVYADGKFTLIE